jgi:hypothetical protein
LSDDIRGKEDAFWIHKKGQKKQGGNSALFFQPLS